MLTNPFDGWKILFKEKVERDRKTTEFIYTQTDSLITWLVGFAFAALSLFVSNISSIRSNLHANSKPIVFFLFLTIVLGLSFRYVSYLMMLFQKGLDNYFAGLFSDFDMTPTEPDEDIDDLDYDSIIKRLSDDFDEAINYPRELSQEEKAKELPELIEHYKELCKHSERQMQLAIEHMAEVDETAYKIEKNHTIENFNKGIKNPKIGYHLKRWNFVRAVLYTCCILSFLTVVSIVSAYLLCL